MAFARKLTLLCLFLVLPSINAQAEFKGLFLLGELRQEVELDYIYSGQKNMPNKGNSTSSSQNHFSETYNAGIEYSILSPYVLTGRLKASFGLDQEMFANSVYSNSSVGNKYSYDFDGTIFKLTPTPANFSVRSETQHIQTPFSPGYDVTSDSYAMGAAFKHKLLALRIDYQNTTSETSGTTSDTRQTNSYLTLMANNVYKNSTTEVQITHSASTLEPLSSGGSAVTNNDSYAIFGTNNLSSSLKDKVLNTSISCREEKQTATTKTVTLGESFTWQLGKALTFGASYENSSVSTSGIAGAAATDSTQQIGNLSLTHLLYKSLSSRLKLQGRLNDRTTGRETEYTGSANFSYTKKLSAADSLTLNYAEEYSVIDRRLSSGWLTATDEPLTAQVIGNNLLQNQNVISSSIIVSDRANPLKRYDVNIDYRINHVGPFTGFDFSVIGSRITDGQKLLVTYQYNVDASVNYSRSAHGGGGAITFFEGTYQVYANISQATQETVSGQTAILLPSSSMDYSLGATRNKNGTYTNIVYMKSDSDQVKTQSIEGTFSITRYFEESSVNAQAKDRQTWYGVTSYNSSAHTENQLSLSADYSRNVFSNGVLTLRTMYFRFVSANREQNDVVLESMYRWGVGKFFLEANGKVQFRSSDGDKALDNQIHLRVTRSF